VGRAGVGARLQRRADEGANGKLIWAGRAWAKGTLFSARRDDLAEEADFWGIDPTLLQVTETSGVWESNVDAVSAFLTIDSQFRFTGVGMGGLVANGLDYAGSRAGLDMAGIAITPALWGAVQLIEAGAVAALNAKRGGLQ
jgi:hypothetical protein